MLTGAAWLGSETALSISKAQRSPTRLLFFSREERRPYHGLDRPPACPMEGNAAGRVVQIVCNPARMFAERPRTQGRLESRFIPLK